MNRMIEQANNRERENLKSKWCQFQNNIIVSGPSVAAAIEDTDVLTGIRQLLRNELSITEHTLTRVNKARPLGRNQEISHKVVLECTDAEMKAEIRDRILSVKPDGVYFSEHLLTEVNTLLYKLRKMKKDGENIARLFTRNGEIIAKKCQEGNSYKILTEFDMEKFLEAADIQSPH